MARRKKSRKKQSGGTKIKNTRKKASKRRAGKTARKKKGRVPLAILEKRLKKLNGIVKSRRGKACSF